jgi:hypothetical protein
MIVRALRLPEATAGTAAYTDVNSSDWFYGDVMKAKSANLVSLLGDTEFKPNQTMTREEMAYVLARAANYNNVAPNTRVNISERFTDSSTISSQYTSFVVTTVSLGLMEGTNIGFESKGKITRAEAATVLVRMCKLFDWIE